MAPAEYSTQKAEDRRTRARQRSVTTPSSHAQRSTLLCHLRQTFVNAQRSTFNAQRSTLLQSRETKSFTRRHLPATLSELRRASRQTSVNSRKGMSLLEVILAIAVAGFVLAAAVSLLVSISSIWSERAERHFFVDHVDGVTEFLNATFATAGVEIAASESSDSEEEEEEEEEEEDKPTGGLVGSSDEPIAWASPPGFAAYKDPLLNFKLTKAPPLLVGLENAPLLGIDAFLYFDESEGLSLLWYSILQEETDNINDLRRTAISPLVTDIQYVYWDESFEKWETEDEPKEGDGTDQYLLPRFITLTFEYEGETQERTFTIPVPSKSALIY